MKKSIVTLLQLFILLFSVSSAPSVSRASTFFTFETPGFPQNPAYAGQFGGSTWAIANDDDIVYAGLGSRFGVFDVSNPNQPLLVNQSKIFEGDVNDIDIDNGLAYVSFYEDGLAVFDLATPTAPQQLSFTPELETIKHMAITKAISTTKNITTTIGLAITNEGLGIVDLANPRNPIKVSSWDQSNLIGVATAGKYAFVHSTDTLFVVDIQQPITPTLSASLVLESLIIDIEYQNNYLYLASVSNGFSIIDVSNPLAPNRVAHVNLPTEAVLGLDVVGNTVYLADSYNGLRVIDASDVNNPVEIGTTGPVGISFNDVIWDVGTLYTADGEGGLHIFDATNPTMPAYLGGYDGFEALLSFKIPNHIVTRSGSKLITVNVSNIDQPAIADSFDSINNIQDFTVNGNIAYLANYARGLRLIDLSNPNNLFLLDAYYDTSPQWYANDVAISNGLAYVSGNGTSDKMRIINVQNPTNIFLEGMYFGNVPFYNLAAAGNYVYAASPDIIEIIDVSNPATPSLANSLALNGIGSIHVQIAGGYLYAVGINETYVFDLVTPTSPQQVSSIPVGGFNPTIHNNRLYIPDSSGGFHVADITDQSNPSLLATIETSGYANGVAVDNDFIYTSAGSSGLLIYHAINTLPKLEITHVEVSHAVQNQTNSLPLIAGKRTFARVYLTCGHGCNGLDNVTGEMYATDLMGRMIGSPIPANISHVSVENSQWQEQRSDLPATLNFTLPNEWTITGAPLEINVEVSAGSLTATYTEQITFDASVSPIKVYYAPIIDDGHQPPSHLFQNAHTYASQIYPINKIEYIRLSTPIRFIRPLLCSSTCLRKWLLISLESYSETNQLDGALVGWLPEESHPDFGIGGEAGSNVFFAIAGRIINGVPQEQSRFAHELGHVQQVQHTNTNSIGFSQNSGSCGTYNGVINYDEVAPYWPHVTSNSLDWGIDGFGFAWLVSSNASLVNPETNYDFMAWCFDNTWISGWTYNEIYKYLLGLPREQTWSSVSGPGHYLNISGIATISGTVQLGASTQFTSTISVPSPNSGTEYCLQTYDVVDNLLDSTCFDLDFEIEEYDQTGPSTHAGFNKTLPYSTDIVRITVESGAIVLDEIVRSPNTPQVTVLTPNGGEQWVGNNDYTISWVGSDGDGDLLTYTVLYSIDGQIWTAFATTTDTQLVVNASDLTGTDTALIRVTVSDGLNNGSDESDATFIVDKKVPTVNILIPEDGWQIPWSTPVLLQANAYDFEDGPLDGNSLVWTSDRDGQLGTGSELLVPNLSFGIHVISVMATDSDGNQEFDSVTILIGEQVYLPILIKP